MSFTELIRRVTYPGPSGTAFPVTFAFQLPADLVVTRILSTGVRTPLVLNTTFTVTGDGQPAGHGLVTVSTALLSGETLVIERTVPFNQPTDIANLGESYQEVIEGALDRVVQQTQQLDYRLSPTLGNQIPEVSVLPTASVDYLNRVVVRRTGGVSTFHICLEQAAGVFAWKQVTLT